MVRVFRLGAKAAAVLVLAVAKVAVVVLAAAPTMMTRRAAVDKAP